MSALLAGLQPACGQQRHGQQAPAAACRFSAAAPFRKAAAPLQPALALMQRRRCQRAALLCRASAAPLDVDTARKLLDGPATVLDIRDPREYEDSRVTKPPRKSVNLPFSAGQDAGAWAAQAAAKFPSTAATLIVMCRDGGQDSAQAAAALAAAGYSAAAQLTGGFQCYSAVWGPSGKRRPPAGRWVSTGKEALKSGLNIPGVAESYDEGGNLVQARWAEGLSPGEELPPMR